MKQLLLLSILISITFFSFSQKSNNQTKNPDIFFVEKSINFGTIIEGKKKYIHYKFYNSGDAPLLLLDVKPSCGCTASKWPREPIMPGDSSEIVAAFNSKGYAGKRAHKSVRVTTNIKEKKGQNKVVILFFKGHVKPKSNK
ncbi:MAG: DUF1573 domain-containing protein [Bacteroidota bacterium]|nr:DUF1573 domain-containing protein [Bacteroidota bacterium]